jgi:hypothetical protein
MLQGRHRQLRQSVVPLCERMNFGYLGPAMVVLHNGIIHMLSCALYRPDEILLRSCEMALASGLTARSGQLNRLIKLCGFKACRIGRARPSAHVERIRDEA